MKRPDYRSMQTETSECGLACIVAASGMLGGELAMGDLRRRFPISTRGSSMRELLEIASANNMIGRAVRCELDELHQIEAPAVLHWGLNHFVVLTKAGRNRVDIFDPAVGNRRIGWKEVSEKFTGIALELSRAPGFQRRAEPSPLRLSSLFRLPAPVRAALLQTFLLSCFMQIYVVLSPFYIQLAVDNAALRGDSEVLGVLAIGFAAFCVFNLISEILRGFAVQRTTSLLNWDMTTRIFRHMIRLPLPWFQRRRLADALTRFDSINPVRQMLSEGLVTSVLDGSLAIATLLMMLLFAPLLSAIVLVGFGLYVLVRLAAIPLNMRLGAEALLASIAEQGKRIETLRAIQSIKLMGAESRRESDWANRYANVISTQQRTANANAVFGAIHHSVRGLVGIATVYVGVRAVIAQEITIGILFAFMAYANQFSERAIALFEQFISWRMLDLYTMRLADIVLTRSEESDEAAVPGLPAIKGRFDIDHLAFQYGPQDKLVFQNLSFTINPGEFVAITGPSGSGKSTLLKVLCGLYAPTFGEIRVDGLPLSAWGNSRLRDALGVVMQDDELLAGSILENVTFFEENVDVDRVWQALSMAAIADEVMAMPMRAETFVGDMGGALSGGQKQRILLARALYRRPQILVLDEATSHLDLRNEKAINEALRGLDITRIVVAHRPETVAAADRVLTLGDAGNGAIASAPRNARSDAKPTSKSNGPSIQFNMRSY